MSKIYAFSCDLQKSERNKIPLFEVGGEGVTRSRRLRLGLMKMSQKSI